MDAPYDPKDHEYPKHRHHASKPMVVVEDPDEEAEKTPDADGWTDNLSDLKDDK